MANTNQASENTLNNGYPTSPSEIIAYLEKSFPIGTTDIYPKIGFVILLLYEIIIQKNNYNDKEYNLEEKYKSIFANLPKTKEEAVKYLSERFRLETPDDYRNLYLLLNMFKVLKYDNKIDSYFQAKSFILDKMTIGSPEYNIRGVVERLTMLVQKATLQNFVEMTNGLPELEARVQELEKQQAALSHRVAALKKLNLQLEQKYEDFIRKGTRVEWKKVSAPFYHPLYPGDYDKSVPKKRVLSYYEGLISEYSDKMGVAHDEAKKIVDAHCPAFTAHQGWLSGRDLLNVGIPQYIVPNFDLDSVLSNIMKGDEDIQGKDFPVSDSSSPEELIDLALKLMTAAKQRMHSEAETIDDGKGSM